MADRYNYRHNRDKNYEKMRGNFYDSSFGNFKEMDDLLKICNLLNLTEKETEILGSPINLKKLYQSIIHIYTHKNKSKTKTPLGSDFKVITTNHSRKSLS